MVINLGAGLSMIDFLLSMGEIPTMRGRLAVLFCHLRI